MEAPYVSQHDVTQLALRTIAVHRTDIEFTSKKINVEIAKSDISLALFALWAVYPTEERFIWTLGQMLAEGNKLDLLDAMRAGELERAAALLLPATIWK